MIRATSSPDGRLRFNASVSGAVVYLDNWAYIGLAKGDKSRRKRFLDAIHSGVDLLFSVTNAAELSGPQGRSAEVVKEFLDQIGPCWFPAKLDATEVIKLEIEGKKPEIACIDETFFKSYVADRMRPHTLSETGKLTEVPSFTDNFFSLGPLLERVGPQRKSISRTSAKFDEMLKNKMGTARNMSKRDPALLDKKFPWIPFDSARPACFAYFNLLRVMVTEASQLKEGDGMDFCHAVMGSAYASFATLDQHWKRRVQSLPKPNGLARIYSGSKLDKGSELDKMVMDIESWVARRAAS